MNNLEDRLRDALRAHAEDFSARPDAWQRLTARNRGRRARRWLAPRRAWPTRFIVPAAAAAAVVVIVVAAALTVSGRTGSAGAPRSAPARTPSPASSPAPGPGYSPSGPAEQMLLVDPPTSAVIGLKVLWTGPKANKVTSYFWLGANNPAYWVDQIVPGRQFCHDTVNGTTGESSGFCWPLPQLGAGHLAQVTGREGVGTDQRILVGTAAAQVTSVTAVLPDGRGYVGVVKTGRGFPEKAWTVGYPPANDVRLVFRNTAGTAVTTLGTAGPIGPPQVAQPKTGGVTVFQYPAGQGTPAGSMIGYLINGRVGFWSPNSGGMIAPVPAAGEPALGGMFLPFAPYDLNRSYRLEKAFGYAHADVARVVLRLPDGRQVSTRTFTAGWPGSNIRLWAASMPSDAGQPGLGMPAITATGYDAAGHVLGQVKLSRPE